MNLLLNHPRLGTEEFAAPQTHAAEQVSALGASGEGEVLCCCALFQVARSVAPGRRTSCRPWGPPPT